MHGGLRGAFAFGASVEPTENSTNMGVCDDLTAGGMNMNEFGSGNSQLYSILIFAGQAWGCVTAMYHVML